MIKKIVVGLFASAVILASSATALAGQRHHQHHGHHHHQQHQHRNYAPYIAGAIGLGILGAIATQQYYSNRECYRRVVGYDYYGNPVVRTFCEYR